MAVGLGPSMVAVTVLRNWHGWEAAPFWLDDLGAGVGLLAAGVFAFNDQDSLKGRLLSAAYGVAVAVLWASLFEHTAGLHSGNVTGWTPIPVLSRVLTLVALILAGGGLLASLPSKRPAFVGTRPEPEKKKARR